MSVLDAVPVLSVIIVSADSGPSLRDCVNSVLACSTPLELLLIDNASSDGIPQAIARGRENDARLKVIYNRTNLGFGPAVNRAAVQARGQVFLILNPDCLIEQSALQRLLDVLKQEQKAGLVGAVVCDAQGVPDPASYRRDPIMQRALATMFGRGSEGVNATGGVPDHVVDAEAVSGAVMLLPRRVFEWLNGFDEKYFLHCEDLDLCRRVRDGGWRVVLAGDVRVLHGKGGSSRHRPVFVSYHKHRGMWRWFRKFDPAAHKPHLAVVVWLGIWAHFVLQIPGQLRRLMTR
ncbi:glycosyltransferase family 2 protein [Dyella caseinilytica]|uniref:Glycosyltransferase family 2 protein n=1 Tax=Dyella caseinilytica TaxID=1849581 RepID=A0ABX7GSC1_9GAMM|nr:glycosyltransferase family 2 protein [Dyella caseinilytica]QRN52809.1 glycosyltransferase family 2 protein [Dyella caseinilytica]GGA08899.1 glycosyl transferase [Dyella caseinilytica]